MDIENILAGYPDFHYIIYDDIIEIQFMLPKELFKFINRQQLYGVKLAGTSTEPLIQRSKAPSVCLFANEAECPYIFKFLDLQNGGRRLVMKSLNRMVGK